MEFFTETCILGFSFYYLYRLIKDYRYLKVSIPFYEENKIYYLISAIGVACLILSFQVYWFTSFYEEHKYISIFVKILLAIFSVFNQLLISDVEKEKEKSRKKKNDDLDELLNKPGDKKLLFKLINRLFLLDIVVRIFSKK